MRRFVIVLAAGLGTRMKSTRAKVLHPLLGRPILVHLLEALSPLGADRTLVVTGYQADVVGPLLAPFGATPVLQEPQLGTGHAFLCCRKELEEEGPGEVLLVAGDVPLLPVDEVHAFWKAFSEASAPAAVITLRLGNPFGYGRILRDGRGEVERIVEEKDATPTQRSVAEVNSGVYLFRVPSVLALLDSLGRENAQGEYYLTDLFRILHRDGSPALSFEAREPGRWLGVNSQADLARATGVLRREIVERWMASGVTILDPDTTWIEPAVRIESGVILHPFVRLCGMSHLSRDVEIRALSVLYDTNLGPGTIVKEYCVLEGTQAGASCFIGPFCHTRPGTILEERVHLGNFVETKKTRMGVGAKANHLSYLGDATVGARSNIGAGTITCNYDGAKKHPTVLGEGVFVGSDTQLVAPVTVGDGAYVGAGTTVTKDVPAGALVISRTPQKVIEGWVARKKERGMVKAAQGAKEEG